MTKNLYSVAVIGTVALLVVLGAIGFVKALNGSPTYIENIEEATIVFGNMPQEDISEDLTLGASGTRFPNGISADSTSPIAGEVRGTTLTLTGAATLNATTTIPRMDASFQTALNFQTATSEGGGVTDPTTQALIGSVQNTGNDLLCTDVWVDISTANTLYAYGLKVGTSTTATSSDAHLINENAAQNDIGTSTTDTLSKEDDEGTSSTEVWTWQAGHYIVVTETFQAANATSSDVKTGNTAAGNLHVNCRNRY